MKAQRILDRRFNVASESFVELVIWQVSKPVRGSVHHYKYRFALVVDQECVLRFDNEAGKGDHRHIGQCELPYAFQGLKKLQDDFYREVDHWLSQRKGSSQSE
jgi:hypothetical protein